MPSTHGGKWQGGHKYRLKLSQEITDSTQLSAGQLYMSLLNKVLSINGKQFCGHEGKGAYPLTCDSVHGGISQVRSSRGYDPPMMPECPGWPRQDINTARPRSQALNSPDLPELTPAHSKAQATRGRNALASWLARLWLLSWSCSWSQHLEHKVKKPFLKLSWLMARANADGETLCCLTSAAKDSAEAVSKNPMLCFLWK